MAIKDNMDPKRIIGGPIWFSTNEDNMTKQPLIRIGRSYIQVYVQVIIL